MAVKAAESGHHKRGILVVESEWIVVNIDREVLCSIFSSVKISLLEYHGYQYIDLQWGSDFEVNT
jgi:hypothetical protein